MTIAPRKMLLNDEGSSALHYLDTESPEQSWSVSGPGRDLQLIGRGRVLRSHGKGYVELDVLRRGALVRDVSVAELPGGVESARRLPNGHTVVIGNGEGGVFVWELDRDNRPITGRQRLFAGIEKARMIRFTEEGSFLFCSETNGRSIVHEGSWDGELRALFEVPDDVPADSMVKAVRIAPDTISVSSGYTASLLVVDTAKSRVLRTIGGKTEPASGVGYQRQIRPFFFSGYQMLANGDYLIANWQGHGPGHRELGHQVLRYSSEGTLLWAFDQTAHAGLESINNVIALDGLDLDKLHDEPQGVLIPVA